MSTAPGAPHGAGRRRPATATRATGPARDTPVGGGDDAARVLEVLRRRGESVAVAESLTGGAVCAALVAVPGASTVLRGGVVAYASDLKASLLGVPAELLAARGAVDRDVVAAMAAGAARATGATWAVATTGVAGPDPQDGRAPGTVHVAVDGPVRRVLDLTVPGGRDEVRAGTVAAALRLLLECAAAADTGDEAGPPDVADTPDEADTVSRAEPVDEADAVGPPAAH